MSVSRETRKTFRSCSSLTSHLRKALRTATGNYDLGIEEYAHVLFKLSLIAVFGFFCVYAIRVSASGANVPPKATQLPLHFSIPKGLPEELWRKSIPRNNPLTEQKIHLGGALYFDKRLSLDGTLSCASC